MAVELHLPDLPDVPISIGSAGPRVRPPWPVRLREAFWSYLPLLLMAALALGTWWLVKNTPVEAPAREVVRAPTVPDYTMRRFTVQRFGAEGQLRVQLEGRELRHFPEGDRIEVDELDLKAFGADGRIITASARRAISNGGATELQLRGGAVVDGIDPTGEPVQIRSEYLQAFLATGIVRTDQAVQVTQGADRLSAGGLEYDSKRRLLRFSGPVRAVLHRTRPGAARKGPG